MSDLVERLRKGNDQMGPHEKLQWEAADRIEELEAVLRKRTLALLDIREATVETDWYWERADLALGGLTWDAVKATEAETPERPSTTVRTPLPSNEATSDLVLQDEFQAHRRHTAIAHQAQSERNLWVTDRLEDQERRIRTLEQRMSEAYQPREGLDPNASTPASQQSASKTPDQPPPLEPTEIWKAVEGETIETKSPTDRRSGKERRVLKSVEICGAVYSAAGVFLYLNRRKISRRKQPTPDIEQQ